MSIASTVDRIGVQGIGQRVGVEDDDGPRRVGRRDERVEIAQIESLVAEGRSEAQAGEVVGHSVALSIRCGTATGSYIRIDAAQRESGKIHVTVRMGDSAGSAMAAVVIAGFCGHRGAGGSRGLRDRARECR